MEINIDYVCCWSGDSELLVQLAERVPSREAAASSVSLPIVQCGVQYRSCV